MNICKEESVHMITKKALDCSVAEMETLLLVDDENAILELCKEFLEQESYTVLTANAPDAAIRIARNYNGKIHMLITDIVMPVVNGLELAETLSSIRSDMKCIFISGCMPEEFFSSEIYERNINFIRKPFRLKELAEKIHNVLNH